MAGWHVVPMVAAAGGRLDPLADKLMISAPLIWLAATAQLPIWSVWLLLARELLISGWRAGSAKWRTCLVAGEMETTLQFLSLFLMLWPASWGSAQLALPMAWAGGCSWPGLGLALWSALAYLRPRSTPRQQ